MAFVQDLCDVLGWWVDVAPSLLNCLCDGLLELWGKTEVWWKGAVTCGLAWCSGASSGVCSLEVIGGPCCTDGAVRGTVCVKGSGVGETVFRNHVGRENVMLVCDVWRWMTDWGGGGVGFFCQVGRWCFEDG